MKHTTASWKKVSAATAQELEALPKIKLGLLNTGSAIYYFPHAYAVEVIPIDKGKSNNVAIRIAIFDLQFGWRILDTEASE